MGDPPRLAPGPLRGLLRAGCLGFGGGFCLTGGGRTSGRGRGWRSVLEGDLGLAGLGGDFGLAGGALTTTGDAAGWCLGL